MRRETLLDFYSDFDNLNADFLVYDDGYRSWTYTYAQVGAAARAFAARLRSEGLHAGDKILIWGENRPEWIVALWGALLAGVVVVPLDYRASAELVARVQSVARAKLLLIGDEVDQETPAAVPHLRLAEVEWGDAAAEPAAASRDDIAEVLFTSGATAEPKGVLITHRNILANIVPVEGEVRKYLAQYKLATRIFFPIRFLNLLPLSHMFGQAMATFIPPMLPGVVVFMRGYSPQEIVRQIKSRRISVLVCVPKILEVLREYVLAAAPEAAEAAPPGERAHQRWWRYRKVHKLFGFKFWAFIVGAAPLDPELESFWRGLGFVVIQGYGLTETAPIVTLNHPFHTKTGSVGKPIAGVEIKISPEGEILVRGENVTRGYLNAEAETRTAFEDGWFHTGDVGVLDESGGLQIRGRLKEMIVTADGLNVFPEDVERVLDHLPGVRESAVIGVNQGGQERVQAVLVVEPGTDENELVRKANAQLEDHQKIRAVTVWPGDSLPRTEGTRKLKRREVKQWLMNGMIPRNAAVQQGEIEQILAKYAPNREITPATTMEELGLSSLERVELLMALEQRFGLTADEGAYAAAKTVADLYKLVQGSGDSGPRPATAPVAEVVDFPSWNRTRLAHFLRRVNLPTWILPLAHIFSWVRAEGLENLAGVEPPVIFAANHQSHFDVPSIFIAMPSKWRYRAAPAMSKEFFKAHFYPKQYSKREWFTNSLNYYLSSLFFNAFPLPQREAGARQTVRYAGDLASEGWCILIFPEGKITLTGEIDRFQPGVGMLASRLHVPVIPVRLFGVDKILRKGWSFPRPGRVRVVFGKPLHLQGDDYAALSRQVENAVRGL